MLLLLLFASYLHCVLTDPGTVPQAWHDRIASDPQLAARYRLCHKSRLYRPPRSHYCSVTERTLTLTLTLTLTPTLTLTLPNPQPQPHPHPRYYIVQQGKVNALALMKDDDRLQLLKVPGWG